MESFTESVKGIALSYTEVIHATEDQDLETISNESIVTHTRREPTASTSKSISNSPKHELFTDDVHDDETEMTDSTEVLRKINSEIERYKCVKMKKIRKTKF